VGAGAGQAGPFDVKAGAASQLALLAPPGEHRAGEPFRPAVRVQVLDETGNVVTRPAVVAAALLAAPSGGALLSAPEDLLATSAGGVAEFAALAVDVAGPGYVLRFSVSDAARLDSPPFVVLPGAPASLRIDPQPGSALRGSPLSVAPAVALLDAFGNLVVDGGGVASHPYRFPHRSPYCSLTPTMFSPGRRGRGRADRLRTGRGPVIVKSLDSALLQAPPRRACPCRLSDARAWPPEQVGTFGGATRQVVAGGVARFDDLSVNNPAPRYRLRFTAAAGVGTLAAESSDFTITGLVSALRVLQQPGGARGGEPIDLQPRLALIDAIGQVRLEARSAARAAVAAGRVALHRVALHSHCAGRSRWCPRRYATCVRRSNRARAAVRRSRPSSRSQPRNWAW